MLQIFWEKTVSCIWEKQTGDQENTTKGLIDNFRIEDKALSVREIEKLAKDYLSKTDNDSG